eukprot:4620569-Amphidinium_carterae.2
MSLRCSKQLRLLNKGSHFISNWRIPAWVAESLFKRSSAHVHAAGKHVVTTSAAASSWSYGIERDLCGAVRQRI